jgi:hypothetical protein
MRYTFGRAVLFAWALATVRGPVCVRVRLHTPPVTPVALNHHLAGHHVKRARVWKATRSRPKAAARLVLEVSAGWSSPVRRRSSLPV